MKRALTAIGLVAGLLFGAVPARAAESAVPSEVGSAENWARLLRGEILLLSAKKSASGGARHVVAAVVIDAPVRSVWEVLDDKESATAYVEDLKRVKVLECRPDGVERIEQTMKINVLIPSSTYVIEHRPEPYQWMRFKRVSGDLKDIEGYWKFVPVEGDQKTLLIYSLSIDPGFLVPQSVIEDSLKKSLPAVLRSLRERIHALEAAKG